MVFQIIGTLAAVVFLFFGAFCVFNERINDGIVGRFIYSGISVSAFAMLIHDYQGTFTLKPGITLLAFLAAASLRYMWMNSAWRKSLQNFFNH